MQAFTPLALLILGVSFVKGDYWWMNNDGAFGGDSDSEPQVKRESSGGYGGGKTKSQAVKGYPQNTEEHSQNNGGYQQNTGGYPQESGGYPQGSVGYPNNGGYPQGNINSPTSSRDPSQKLQDHSGSVCAAGLSCVPQSQCQQPRETGIQERVANYIQCGPNKVCCGKSTASSDPFVGSGSSPLSSSITQQQVGNIQLPETQCQEGWKCVSDLFCDASATMVPFRVELTQNERRKRGKLTPCMNQITQQFDVCCRKPPVIAQIEKNQLNKFEKQKIKPTSCPVVNVLPPIEQCRGRPSNCWSVGVPDTDCVGHALCCFDGCANVCQGEGPVKGNPGPQNNARGQQRQNTVSNAINNVDANKPEDLQDITQQGVNQDVGASSLEFETIKKPNPPGYSGQQLPTPNEPLLISIQKQKPIKSEQPKSAAQTEPQINTIQIQPIKEQSEILEDPSQTNIQYTPDNGNFVESSPAFSAVPEQSPASYPNIDTNTQRIVFPDDEEEKYFPSYPQTDVFSSTAQVVSSTSKSFPLQQISTSPTTVQPIQPSSSSTPIQNAASQPFITCPSAMKCVEKINCNFNGVMVEQPVFLNPEQETQRVT